MGVNNCVIIYTREFSYTREDALKLKLIFYQYKDVQRVNLSPMLYDTQNHHLVLTLIVCSNRTSSATSFGLPPTDTAQRHRRGSYPANYGD
jgi:hypothetical protein